MENVIIRFEQKYLLSLAKAKELERRLQGHMQADGYGRQTICSLYYDTEDLAAAQGKEHKKSYREKLRIRSYGVPDAESPVYMELKKKICGVSCKRRAALCWHEAEVACQSGRLPLKAGQIGGEIGWFLQRQAPLPKAVISYDRLAFYGTEEPDLRLTLDQNLRCRGEALSLSQGDWGEPMLPPGRVMMEIKAPGALPFWLAEMLAGLGIYPCSFSKYQTAAQNGFYKGGKAHAV